jgi:prepilin-type processing-associated H-X9-DG protein
MPVSFVCPHCGIKTEVADRFAGQTGPCASCGKTITIAAPDPVSAPLPGARDPSAGPSVLLILGVIGGALFGVVVVVGILAALAIPAINSARKSSQTFQCSANLSQIGMAMNQYAAQYGTYPPAYTTDDEGNPMHGWRVLLLPYLGSEGQLLSQQYDMSQAWDSEINSQLVGRMPGVFGCQTDAGFGIGETSYLVITGPEFLFEADNGKRPEQILDDPANTLMVVEVCNSGINWLEPRDLDGSRITFQVDTGAQGEIGSFHPLGANVLMADGTLQTLDSAKPAEVVRAMATIDGGD